MDTTNKVRIVRLIANGYFIGAMVASASHIIVSADKLGLDGVEKFATVPMIDGIALTGLIMRSRDFDDRTNKIGLWTQAIAGLLSLTMNVYAAKNSGGVLFGVAVVALFLFAEFLRGAIRSRRDAEAAQAVADAEATIAAVATIAAACPHPTKCTTADQCAKKTAAALKARKTTERKTRAAHQERRVLDRMIKA